MVIVGADRPGGGAAAGEPATEVRQRQESVSVQGGKPKRSVCLPEQLQLINRRKRTLTDRLCELTVWIKRNHEASQSDAEYGGLYNNTWFPANTQFSSHGWIRTVVNPGRVSSGSCTGETTSSLVLWVDLKVGAGWNCVSLCWHKKGFFMWLKRYHLT